jgi:Holliday junction DNA helicase RuvA subunit
MIAYISWKIIDLDFHNITILTSGWVWYDIWINELTYSKISLDTNENMYIYHHITENNQSLFGFISLEEKQIFTNLIKISWVGWKVAMQILSLWIERLIWAIKSEDKKTIQWIKGIWKKMSEKIIIELKDKDFWIQIENNVNNIIDVDLFHSIKSTLTNMWYNPKDIDKTLNELPEWISEASDILPYVIKQLS